GEAPQVAGAAELPIAGRRHFLLLFDLSFTRNRSLSLATRAARELVHSGLHPTDLVGVAVFGVTSGAEVLLGFTPDRRQVDKTLDTLDRLLDRDLPPPPETRSPSAVDTLRLIALTYRDLVVQFGRTAGVEVSPAWEALEWGVFDGLGGGPMAETLFEMDGDQRQGIRERRRSAVYQLASSLGELAKLTSGIDGRKFLVYFSEGFDSSLMYEEGGARTLRTIREMIDQIRRAGWTVQSVDPSGLREDERPFDNVESLLSVAKDTGGELYQNFNDLGSAMEGMLEKTSVTYLLSFHAADLEADGSYHPLRVELRDGPPGARVLYRPGYYAPKPLAEQEELESVVETAELILSGREGGEIDASALVAPFKGPADGDGVTVAVWIEADGSDLLAEHHGETLEVDVFGYALDGDGEIHDFFSQKMNLDLGQARENPPFVPLRGNLEQGGLKFYGELDLRPGRYDLRVLVRAAETGRYALRIVPVSVADLSGSDPVLLPPVFVD
ncbi:MAG: VWA domain-containing protein, partial [bacterium]|nr:VWA domain-containing protein [bacterium]